MKGGVSAPGTPRSRALFGGSLGRSAHDATKDEVAGGKRVGIAQGTERYVRRGPVADPGNGAKIVDGNVMIIDRVEIEVAGVHRSRGGEQRTRRRPADTDATELGLARRRKP